MGRRPHRTPPEGTPTYTGELPAIADVEAHGWTVFWHDTGFDFYDQATAIHPTCGASPMALTSFELRMGHHWWWRPMVQIPHVGALQNHGTSRSTRRITTHKASMRTPFRRSRNVT